MRIKGIGVLLFILFSMMWFHIDSVFADKAIIQVDHLNVRTGPGTNYDRIGQVHTDESYQIIKDQNNWLNIKWKGRHAWIAKWLTNVKSTQAYSSKVDYLRIRSKAGLHGSIKGYLMKNDQARKLDQKGDWILIEHSGEQGWVHGDYLKAVHSNQQGKAPVEANPPEKSSRQTLGKVKIGTAALNVRSDGSLNGNVITQVYRGKQYEYIDEENGWYQIKWSEGKKGWVAGWLVDEISASSPSETAKSSYIILQYNGTNLRNGPSTNDKIVGRGSKGQQFEVLDKQGRWYRISYQNKKAYVAGWIVDQYSSKSTPSPTTNGNLRGRTIMVDAGHGGRDSGAVGYRGSYEKTLTLQTTTKLKQQLENKGAKVLFTRNNNQYVSLGIRSYYSNSSQADAFISVHYNSAPTHRSASGISTYYYHTKDKSLASSVQSQMVKTTGMRDRNIRFGNFHVLRENNKPALLLELGFISNPDEEQTVRGTHYQNQVTDGIVQGLIDHFN